MLLESFLINWKSTIDIIHLFIKLLIIISHKIDYTTPTYPVSQSASTELSPDESQPAINPDTTMWPVTQRTNDTSDASSSESSTESSFNETSSANPSSGAPSLEGVDYKTSKEVKRKYIFTK